MEDMSGKVQNANTHLLQCQNHEHAHSSRSVQGPVQWGDGTVHVGSIRGKAHPLRLPSGRDPVQVSLAPDARKLAIQTADQGRWRVEVIDLSGLLEPDGPGGPRSTTPGDANR